MHGPEHTGSPMVGGLDTDSNLFDFFHEHVDNAVEEQSRAVSEEGVWYLTGLLVEGARPSEPAEGGATTLAELHMKARVGDRATAIRAYRRLGDRALVATGFFPGSLSRKLVSRRYYLDMGAAAYDTLAGLLRAAGFGRSRVVGDDSGLKGLDAVYEELAQAYETCAEVLSSVREAVRESNEKQLSDGDILSLYEEWLATGSPRLAARLTSLGVVPVRGDSRGSH